MTSTSMNKTVSIGYSPLVYMALVVLALTLEPFSFRVPDTFHVVVRGAARDVAENILMFVPLGFLYRTGGKRSVSWYAVEALALGLVFSLVIEGLQFYLPQRVTTVSDVIANGMGAWLGALLYDGVTRRIDERQLVKVLSLDLPLSTLVYLLIPLAWINNLCARMDHSRHLLNLFPAVMASTIISSVYVHRFKRQSGAAVYAAVCMSLLFLALAMMPILSSQPLIAAGLAMVMGGLTLYQVTLGNTKNGGEKRFELSTLKKILPLFGLYLFLLALWPFPLEFKEFSLNTGLVHGLHRRGEPGFYLGLEMAVAFSVFGYIAAELRSRKNESKRSCLWRVSLLSCLNACAVELFKGFRAGDSCSVFEGCLFVLAGVYGGFIYLNIARALMPDPKVHTGRLFH